MCPHVTCFFGPPEPTTQRASRSVQHFFGRPFVKRFALCYRTAVCLSCPVCNVGVYGQTAVWIKMKLCIELSLVPGNIVLDGEPAPPPQRGTGAIFGPCLLSPISAILLSNCLHSSRQSVDRRACPGMSFPHKNCAFAHGDLPGPHLTHASLGPPTSRSVTQTASRSVQQFLQGSLP